MPYYGNSYALNNHELRAVLQNPSLLYAPEAPVTNDNPATMDKTPMADEELPTRAPAPTTKTSTKSSPDNTVDLLDIPDDNNALKTPNRGWETDGLTPGQMYDYRRKFQDCQRGSYPVCMEEIGYARRRNARVTAWDHTVHADQEELEIEQGRWMTFMDIGFEDDNEFDEVYRRKEPFSETWTSLKEFNLWKNKRTIAAGHQLYDDKGVLFDTIEVSENQHGAN